MLVFILVFMVLRLRTTIDSKVLLWLVLILLMRKIVRMVVNEIAFIVSKIMALLAELAKMLKRTLPLPKFCAILPILASFLIVLRVIRLLVRLLIRHMHLTYLPIILLLVTLLLRWSLPLSHTLLLMRLLHRHILLSIKTSPIRPRRMEVHTILIRTARLILCKPVTLRLFLTLIIISSLIRISTTKILRLISKVLWLLLHAKLRICGLLLEHF